MKSVDLKYVSGLTTIKSISDQVKINSKKKLLIYSDCYIYGGSERLMSSIIRSKELNAEYEIVLAYRFHKIYEEGLKSEYSITERQKYFAPICILSHVTLIYRLNLLGVPRLLLLPLIAFFRVIEKTGIYLLWNTVRFFFLLKKHRPDIIHINNGGYPGAKSCTHLALVATFMHPYKAVYQINNMAQQKSCWSDGLIDKRLSKYCQFVTASKCALSRLQSERGLPRGCITQVFNTAPNDVVMGTRAELLKQWSVPEGKVILSQVAFLTERKGQRYLLGALHKLKARQPHLVRNLVLFLVGDGEDLELLKGLCHKYELDSNIRFTGYQTNSIEYLAHCDIFLLPSVADEDMPLVVLSAMKLGIRIIASRFAGIEEEIEDGVSGILVNPNRSTIEFALADAIELQLLHPNTALGFAARLRYEAFFSETAYAHSLKRLYGNLGRKE